MSNAVINIRTQPEVKQAAQRLAAELGFSLSALINAFLKQFIRTKTVFFTLQEEPTDFLIKKLKQSEEERKRGDLYSFSSKKALRFIDKLIDE